MEFLRAFIAFIMFTALMTLMRRAGIKLSNDAELLSMAIVVAGALAHSEK